jgi:hypothetical protein
MSKIMRFVSIFVLAVALLFPAILAEPALAESPEISKSSFSSIIEGTINSLPVLTQGPVGIVEIEDNLPIKEGNLNDISPYLPALTGLAQGAVGIVEIEDNLPIKEGNLNDISPYLPALPIRNSANLQLIEKNDKTPDIEVNIRATYPISGSIAPNKGKYWQIYRTAGSQSTFSCQWSPSVSIPVGIIDDSGNWLGGGYYAGRCTLTATFNQSGNYSWVLLNNSSSTITYNGSITY